MPPSIEAIYDVLRAKRDRAEEERRRRDKRSKDYQLWAEYEAENARANAAACSPRSWWK